MAPNPHQKPSTGATPPNRHATIIENIVRACGISEQGINLLKDENREIYEILDNNTELNDEIRDDLSARSRDLGEAQMIIQQNLGRVNRAYDMFNVLSDVVFEILFDRVTASLGDTGLQNVASNDSTSIVDNQITALVVDNNKVARSFYGQQLTKRGVVTRVVDHGEKALEICGGADGFDLILMDCDICTLNPAKEVRMLREMGVKSKIFGYTSSSNMSKLAGITELLDCGMDDVHVKPLSLEKMESAVMEINNKKAHRRLNQ